MDSEPVPANAGAGPPDETPRAAQAPGYQESESLEPDTSLADPAVQAAS